VTKAVLKGDEVSWNKCGWLCWDAVLVEVALVPLENVEWDVQVVKMATSLGYVVLMQKIEDYCCVRIIT
jgi:hypothetical protein